MSIVKGRNFDIEINGEKLFVVDGVINIDDQPIGISKEDSAAIDCFIKTGVSIGQVTIDP